MARATAATPAFLPFLPQDNINADVAAEEAVELISEDLRNLLRSTRKEFWNAVERDDSLAACIDSFLRFRRYSRLCAPPAVNAEADERPNRALLPSYWR